MPNQERSSQRRKNSYRFLTQRPFNCLVLLLGPLLFFQFGTAYYGSTVLLAPRDLNKLLGFFGATAAYLPAVLIAIVLILQHIAHRDPWQVQPKVIAGMVGESIIFMVPLIGLSHLTGKLVAQAAQTPHPWSGTLQNILIAVGAGIYEEFIFRLAIISLLLLILVDVFGLRKDIMAVGAVIIAGCLFSLYHFSIEQLSNLTSFPWAELIFRATAGIYLGVIFVYRGFGITVGAHILYNLYAVMRLP